jgi:hypothetical protein
MSLLTASSKNDLHPKFTASIIVQLREVRPALLMTGIKHDKHLRYGPLTCQETFFLGIAPIQQVIWVAPEA